MTIVRDMAYDSVDRVNMIGGISEDDDQVIATNEYTFGPAC
ncbi:hypothetical protein ACERZ8_21590 [Tateyamaria armeniaca]|uniref:Uncharacterized protein n=1 Tax=Tateyamaria armeniaca TaxID=2518930 RepID=A0ABW8V2U9_9RHOB